MKKKSNAMFVEINVFNSCKIHKGDKLYKCNFCEKRFSFRNKLKPHALADLGDPSNRSKVPCRKCKIEFTNRATLRAHFRINTLVKRFLNVRNVTRHLQGLTT